MVPLFGYYRFESYLQEVYKISVLLYIVVLSNDINFMTSFLYKVVACPMTSIS